MLLSKINEFHLIASSLSATDKSLSLKLSSTYNHNGFRCLHYDQLLLPEVYYHINYTWNIIFIFWANDLNYLYVIIMWRTSFRVNPHFIVCLNFKELLARSRHHIWNLSDSNGIRTHKDLVRKRTLNHLAKLASLAIWLNVRLRTKWLWVRVLLSHLNFRYRACFEQGVSWH